MNKFGILALSLLFSVSAWSQSMDMWETNVASSTDKSQDVIVSWTIGQVLGNAEGDVASLITTITSTVLLGVEPNVEKQTLEVSLYPNPAHEQLNLNLGKHSSDIRIMMYNVNGAVVFTNAYKGSSITISTAQMPDGVYFVKALSEDNEIAVKQIIIKH